MWKYYNHSFIADVPPHEDINILLNPINWKSNKNALLACWTTDFDCAYYKDFWYVIKDTPFDLQEVKAKRRYEIKKSLNNFDVRLVNPKDHINELFSVQEQAFSAYPKKYRPKSNIDQFAKDIVTRGGGGWSVFAAFFKQNNELCGYSIINVNDRVIEFAVQKTKPQYEKYQINAGLVFGILQYFSEDLKNGKYICDGTRNISHETKFQDYLEKYFNFRKAYCKLNIKYRPVIKPIVKLLFVFRKTLKKLDNNSLVHNINGVLKMEEIIREQKKGSIKIGK